MKLRFPYKNSAYYIRLIASIILLTSLWFISSCDYSQSAEKRAARAEESQKDIVIGVVDSLPHSFFTEGVNLAITELNQKGVLGKQIKPVYYNDENSVEKGQSIARKICSNEDMIAIIGHQRSNIAIPVSITYEKNSVLFISPGATDPNLTKYGGEFIFRNTPSTEEIAQKLAAFAQRQGFQKMVIFYERELVNKRFAEIFHEQASLLGIQVFTSRSFFQWQRDFKSLISEVIREHKFDAVFLAGVLPGAAYFIKEARDMDIKVPIMGGYALDSPQIFSVAGKSAEGVIVPAIFDPTRPVKITRDFVKKFEKEVGVTPDIWAAQGYDAVQLLGYAIKKSGSTVPIVLASVLRFLEDWQGITGTYSFLPNGDIKGKAISFKEFRNGKFEFIEHQYDLEMDISPFYVVEDVTLRLPAEGLIPTIDPGLTQDTTSIEITEQLFLGLTDYSPETYEPVPELAKNWTVSEDGTVYQFNMREDVKWTHGEPVTAHDLVWAIQRNIKPETECPYAYMLYILKNGQGINSGDIKDISSLGVRAIDDFTVEFTLEHSATYFPSMAGLWIYRPLPRKIIEQYGEQWTDPKYIQSNGSYKLAAWHRGMMMILRKNPQYYDASNVSIQEVRYFIIPESSLGLAMYEKNELDIMGSSYLRLPLAAIPRIKENPELNPDYSVAPYFAIYSYGFNTLRPPMDNPLVRKAISAAIDRELLIRLVTRGGEEPAATFTRPPIFGSVAPSQEVGIRFNPVQAKKWLAEAGYPEGKGFPEIVLMFNTSETHSKIAEAVKACLNHHLNINIRLEDKKWEDFVASMEQPHTPHMFRFGFSADYPDANNCLNELFHPFKSANRIGWKNQEFAEIMDRAERSNVPEERKMLYQRAEEILTQEEAAIIPLYFEIAHCLVKPRVKGWYHMALGGQHIRNWSLK